MAASIVHTPELTLGIALAAGMVSQSVAHHLKVPGIVILLAVGVLLGPDVLHLIDPSTLGTGLNALVGFAVAIILFEGGLSLRLSRLRAGGPAIRQLLTVGALVTAVGGALAAKFCLLWPWRTSLLFGTLIIVTGPTVVTPLLRRLKVQQRVSNVLEAEGVLIDAIGAITAVVALDIAISPGGGGLLSGALEIISRLGFGSLLGLAGGALIAWVLRFEKLVPDGLENVLTLSLVIALFQVSNYMMHESGLAAVTVAGVVMGNIDSEGHDDMREFKEQLTMLLIGLLFVLLAADVRVSEVVALGWRGAATVAAVLLIVRPLNVWASTIGSGLTGKERLFMAWMGPRGIVAAAVASLFANELDRYGVEGGSELRALVFLTITASVLVSGLTGGFVARALGLGRTLNEGWIVLGAQDLPHTLAGILKKHGGGAMCIDRNPEHVRLAHLKGVDAVAGNVLEERVLFDARLHSRAGFIGLSPNEELNLKFIERAQELGGEGTFVVSLTDAEESVSAAMVHNDRATVMFGRERDLDAWSVLLRLKAARMMSYRLVEGAQPGAEGRTPGREPDALLPLAMLREGQLARPVDDTVRYEVGDRVWFVINRREQEKADDWLKWWGWEIVHDGEAAS